MFLSKLALYGGVAGTFFAVSAFSTVQITKQMNKIPVPNEVESEEDEEEELVVRQMSDTEKFINSLTAFGNMEGNLNVNVTKGDYTLAINGDVFVSMESMDNIMFDASLAVTTLGHTFNIGATYIDNTVFATIEGNNLKLKTSDINEITSLFSSMESSIELPDTFKNIDTTALITNLSAMKAEKGEDKITYTCNLIEGIPPIIFTSDFDYNMTGVSLSNFEIEGFNINVNATTKILGKGHNKVTNPETSEKVYTDVSSYFSVIKQVNNLINTQEAGLTYNVNLTKAGNSLISTTGNANVRIKNGLDLVVNGQLNNSDNTKHVNYTLGYQANNAFLNSNDLIKVYYDVNNFSNLKSSINALISNPDIATLISNLESVELPIVKMINEKDYNGLIENYKGLFLSKDQIKLSVSNSLFSNDSSNIDIVVNLNENGIKDVNISNLRYSDYALSLSVAINEYHNEVVDLSTYRNVSNIDKIIDQVNKLITDKSFNITINNLSYGDLSVNGYIQLDLVNKIYQADVNINKKYINEDDEVAYHTYHIRFDTDATNYYLAYNDEKANSDVKVALSKDSVTSIITDVKNFLANKDGELMNLASYLLDKFNVNTNLPEVKLDSNINVLDLLFEDYIKSVDMSNESSVNIVVNGSKLALDNDINLAIGLNEDSTISGLSGNLEINAKNLEFNVNLNDFNKNIAPFDASEKAPYIVNGNTNVGGWIGMSDISNAVKYVTTLDNETQLAIANQIKDIIENKQVGVNYDINVSKKTNDVNEIIFNMNGNLDLKINDVNDINSYLISLNSTITNEDINKILDGEINLKLYEGKLYLNYDNKHKLSCSISSIKELVAFIESKVANNTTLDVSSVLKKVFNDDESTPIVDIINNKNYASIINYYKGAYIDNDNVLNVVIDGSLLGNEDTDIVIKLKADNKGISNITLKGVYALGYTLDLSLDLTSYQEITMSEEEKASYSDVINYFSSIEQISNLINAKEAGLTYNVSLTKSGKDMLSTSGEANISLKDGLDIVANGQLNNSDNTKHVNYTLGYQNNNAFLNFNDLIKVYYDVNNFSNLKSSINTLISNPDIATLISNLESVELPIVKMINEKDYDGLLATYEGLILDDDQIKLSVSNSLFSNDSSNIDIVINLNENGIKDVNISNLRYSDYALSLSVAINEYHNEVVDLSSYRNVSNIDKIIDQVNKLITDKSFNITINNLSYGDLSVNGYIQLDLVNKIYQADVNINKKYINEDDEVAYHTYHIRFDTDATNYYLAYNDEKDNSDVKVALSKDSVTSIITDVKNFLANKDSELMNLASYLLDKFEVNINLPEVKLDSNINVLDLLFEDYIKSVDMSNESSVNIVVNGSKLALDNDINLAIGLNEDSTISGLSGNLEINTKNLEFNVNLNDFDNTLAPFDASEKAPYIVNGNTNVGGWIGMSDISNAVKYVTTLDNETQLAIANQIKDIIENKQVGVNYDINVSKKTNDVNEIIFNMNGNLDLKINDVNDINSYLISLNSTITNEDINKILDGEINLKLYEGKLYLNYDNKHKLSCSISSIKELVAFIESKVANNTTLDVSSVLKKVFNDDESTPIVDIINNKNYASIINYYKGAYIDNDNVLNVVIDGSLLGNEDTDIVIKLKADNKGISNITLKGVYALGYTLDLSLDLTSYQEITMSEEEKASYSDVINYFSSIEQISNLINAKEAGLTYNVSLTKSGKDMLSTSGEANISLKDGLDIVANGQLNNSDNTKHVNYTLGYQANNAFLNFNDLIKVYYDVNNFSNLKSSINALINNPDIASLFSNLESVELPIVKMINEKDYDGLLATYEGLILDDDQIKLSVSNSLFSNDSSNIDIVINLNENGIKDVNISNLRYSDYALSLSVAINEYHNEVVDLSSYRNVSNIDKIIDQVNKLITDKSFNITINNLSYGDLSVNGYIQLDLINKTYQADVNINKKYINEDDEVAYHTYHIRFDTDATNYYLAYNDEKDNSDVKVALSKDSVTSIITDVKNFLANKDSELMNLASYLLDKFEVNINLPEVKLDSNINVLDLLFEDYIKSVDMSNESSVNIVVNGSKLALDNDINLAIGLNEDSTISGLSGNLEINTKNLEFNVNLNDFDNTLAPFDASEKAPYIVNGNTNVGGWIGMSDISNAVKYVTTLDNETQLAISNQVKDIIENKQVGVNYDINVSKKVNDSNELIFNMNGDFDLKINDADDINSYLISLSGNMVNEDELKALDSNIDIKLYEGKLYFNYNDKLKLAYGIDDIKDLVSIIKSKITNNTTTEVTEVLNQLFPSGSDTNTAPLISIINNKNYASIINYYKGAYIDNDNKLNVVIDGSLIGNANTDIVIKLKADNNGISNITLNGVYALGYTLDFNLDFTSYRDVTMSEEEKASYTDLKYINNIFDKVANLVNKDKFALTLSGNLNLGKGDITINGNSYVSLGESNDFGVAELNITSNNKTHNVKIDVNRNKVSKDATTEEKDNALRTSEVLFSYNNNLKGSLNLKSLTETFDLVKQLASDGNPLLDKIKGLLTRDTTESTITKIMNGEPEAILYDNSLEAINYDVDALGYHYDIVLNGNLLKSDEEDTVEPIHIYINLDDNHEFTGIGIKGRLNTYTLDIDLGIEEASSNTISWNRLTKNSSYYDFSNIKTLIEYLFETGTKSDFIINGTLHPSILGEAPITAQVHVDKDNKSTEAKVTITDMPDMQGGSLLLGRKRTITIYIYERQITNINGEKESLTEVYLDVVRKKITGSTLEHKHTKVTLEELMDKPIYYLVDYCLGISVDGSSDSSNEIDLSTFLTSYKYSVEAGAPTWTLGLGTSQVNGALGDTSITIKGDTNSNVLKSINAKLNVIGIFELSLKNTTLDTTTPVSQSVRNEIVSHF